MAGIAQVYSSIISQIKSSTDFKFVHIWNNQLQQLEDGDTYAFPFPCAFVEILPPTGFQIGQGYNVSDLTVRIHIGHEEYDAGNGNFEENVNVFTYRDYVINALTSFQPYNCSHLQKQGEASDNVHTNIYHYTIDFICSFVDTKGSINEQQTFITKLPPTGLVINGIAEGIYPLIFDETFENTFN